MFVNHSGPERGVMTKGVFSLEECLESLESLEHGQILFCFPQSGDSLDCLESLEDGLFWKTLLLKTPFSKPEQLTLREKYENRLTILLTRHFSPYVINSKTVM